MNAYTIAPLIAALAYIPLLVSTAFSRPWQKRNTLFILFLISAMIWSIVDVFLRSDFFPEHKFLFFQLIVITYTLMVVQFHCFTSSFFGPGRGRWLPFAYGSLLVITGLVFAGYVPESVAIIGKGMHLDYGRGIIFVFIPLIAIGIRNIYVFWAGYRSSDNPVIRNQILSLMFGIVILSLFTIISIFLPWGKEFPISHFANLINAFILSFAVIRHHLVDIRVVLQRGTGWITLGMLGAICYWLVFILLDAVFNFKLDLNVSLVATALAMAAAVFIYKLKAYFFAALNRAFQGSRHDYYRRLTDFAGEIQNIFSLREQGGELLGLLTKAINIKQACLLFPEAGSGDFFTHFVEPRDKSGQLAEFRLRAGNPVIRYLEKEQKPLTKENLGILPAFLGLWPKEKEEIETKEISMFVPLISRERLIAILVLGSKQSGRYSLEELRIIEDVTGRVAVSMEKEFLREQLREREEELSIINNSSFILSSSLDIQEIFGTFVEELRKVVDVEWASIVLLDGNDLCCVALSSVEGSAYQVGERIPLEGTGSGWVITQKKVFVESDLAQGKYFKASGNFYEQGLRTVAYLPLLAKGRAIGSFVIASRRPNAYTQRHIKLLEQLASQIAMPLENTLLYARAEKKARIDELTGLLNRRSLDEMIDNEISRHSRYGGVFSLAILDLDSFKAFNDSYGHPAGDRLLRQVGNVIKSAIRNADRAFRYGGDEFAILLPQTPIEDGFQVTERVRKSIADGVNSGDIPVTISIGLASWPNDGISHTDIIAAADATLYRAKRSGGNQSCRTAGALPAAPVGGLAEEPGNTIDTRILEVVRAMAETVDSRSYYTFNHSKRVTDYALALGRMLKLGTTELSRLETCALMHDVGKMGISDTVINKTSELTGEEWELIKTHPRLGADIAGRIPELEPCVGGILHHHEWYDGSGYPAGLKGDEIPLEARILAIADAYVAMTSERAYSGTMNHERAIEELKKYAGKQFDPLLLEQFASLDRGQISEDSKKARR